MDVKQKITLGILGSCARGARIRSFRKTPFQKLFKRLGVTLAIYALTTFTCRFLLGPPSALSLNFVEI